MPALDKDQRIEELLAGRTVTQVKREQDWLVLHLDSGFKIYFQDIGALIVHPDPGAEN